MNEKKQQNAYPLRMPAELRAEVEAAAHENKRSVNAEILARLERSFSDLDDIGISDRMRMNGEGLEASDEPRITGVNKDLLLTSIEAEQLVRKRDLNDMLMDAMSEVLDSLRGGPPKPGSPTSGPKPRKRFPKP